MTRERAILLATSTALKRMVELQGDTVRAWAWHVQSCPECREVFASFVRERFGWLVAGNLVR